MNTARNFRTRSENPVSITFTNVISAVKRVVRDVSNGIGDSPEFDNVRDLLATVPFSTGEYGLARQRLQNAVCYGRGGKNGAARYELMLLLRNLITRKEAMASGNA